MQEIRWNGVWKFVLTYILNSAQDLYDGFIAIPYARTNLEPICTRRSSSEG